MPWPDRRDGLARSETARNPVDDAACDLWAPLPEVAQAPSLLPLMLNCENGDRAELRREQHVRRRRQDAWPSMRAVAAQVATRVWARVLDRWGRARVQVPIPGERRWSFIFLGLRPGVRGAATQRRAQPGRDLDPRAVPEVAPGSDFRGHRVAGIAA